MSHIKADLFEIFFNNTVKFTHLTCHCHAIADKKSGVGIIVSLQAKYFEIRHINKNANIVISECRESEALSPDMPLIILPSIIEEEKAKIYFFENLAKYFWILKFANNVTLACRELQAILPDIQIVLLSITKE